MFMNIIVIIFVLGIAYTWMTRGVFNSMLHALCVFFAGAIAFAVWEPLAMIFLGLSDMPLVEGIAWGVSLILPFVIMMIIFRVITDKVVKANIRNATAVDYAGGALFGLISSGLTAGILIIAIGYMRLPSTFLGYQPVDYSSERNGAGSLVAKDKLWIPVDSLTAMVYSNLSEGSMSSSQSLKTWYPDLTLTGYAARINPGEGAARNAITEDAFKVVSAYTVGTSTDAMSLSVGDHSFVDISGKNITPQMAGYVAGYVVEFGPKAKEKGSKGGQVVISNGQIRLLTEKNDGSTSTIFPIAAISESTTQGQYGRWLFDSEDLFITSSGGKSRIPMGFEFFVPADETPVALYVKNIRVPVSSINANQEFATADAREKLINSGALLTGERVKREFDLSEAVSIGEDVRNARFSESIGTVMPSQLVKQRGLKINDDNEITEGSGKFISEEIGRKNTPQTKSLRVEKFTFGSSQRMVQVQVGSGIEGGFLSAAANIAEADQPFMLIDTDGNEYEAVGFISEDDSTDIYEIRYTPGSTLSGFNENGLPNISQSKDGQKLTLIFLVSSKVDIQYYTIGDVVQMIFDPALES
jgi:hypothetical protein